MENGSLQYENQILKSELEAEHFILTQMAELGTHMSGVMKVLNHRLMNFRI